MYVWVFYAVLYIVFSTLTQSLCCFCLSLNFTHMQRSDQNKTLVAHCISRLHESSQNVAATRTTLNPERTMCVVIVAQKDVRVQRKKRRADESEACRALRSGAKNTIVLRTSSLVIAVLYFSIVHSGSQLRPNSSRQWNLFGRVSPTEDNI